MIAIILSIVFGCFWLMTLYGYVEARSSRDLVQDENNRLKKTLFHLHKAHDIPIKEIDAAIEGSVNGPSEEYNAFNASLEGSVS